MWHASVRADNSGVRRRSAVKALTGVGAKGLGEWHEDRPGAYHIRRRLRPNEERIIGPAKDLRGTVEAQVIAENFLQKMRGHVAYQLAQELVREELNG